MLMMINFSVNAAVIVFDTCQFIVPYRIASSLSRNLGMASNTITTESGILLIW